MKKTIVALMALSGMVLANTTYTILADVAQVTGSNTTSSITNNTATAGTLALTIDVEAFSTTLKKQPVRVAINL